MTDSIEAPQLNEENRPEAIPPEENHPEVSHPEADRPKKTVNTSKIVTIILGVFLGIAIIAAAGLGFWANQLNTNLNATQKKLTTLQSDYDSLKANNGQLTTNLSQVNSDLDQTKTTLTNTQTTLTNTQTQLTGAQSDLAKASSDKNDLQSKIVKIKPYLDLAYAIYVTDENKTGIDERVNATNDSKLSSLWSSLKSDPSRDNATAFVNYLFGAMSDSIK